MAWFRYYDEALDDPKVQELDPTDFRHWVNLLCIAKRYNGRFPAVSVTAFHLRLDEIACRSVLDRLTIAGLIDTCKGGANGSYIAPHNWQIRQYKSDSSTERVKRFRNASKALHETGPETETETETESKKETSLREVKKNGAHAPAPKQKVLKKGTRLDESWLPRDRDVDLAESWGLNGEEIKYEHAQFTDYWLSKTEKATKLDWDRTWQKWMRKAANDKRDRENRKKAWEIQRERSRQH